MDAIRDAIWYAIRDAISDAIRDAIRDAIYDTIRDGIRDAISDAIREAIWDAIQDTIWDAILGAISFRNRFFWYYIGVISRRSRIRLVLGVAIWRLFFLQMSLVHNDATNKMLRHNHHINHATKWVVEGYVETKGLCW